MLYKIIIVLLLGGVCYSQNTDSLYQLNLRLFINDYQYLDSAYSSALAEIRLSDSALTVQAGTIIDLKEMNFRQEETIAVLKQKIIALNESGLPWYAYGAAGGLVLIIGILTGLLIK